MEFLKFERLYLVFLNFSCNFQTNSKSRKSLLHKAFRDFVLEIFLEIFFVCVAGVIFLDKYEYRIHMPRGFMDDLEGKVVGEKIYERSLWKHSTTHPPCSTAENTFHRKAHASCNTAKNTLRLLTIHRAYGKIVSQKNKRSSSEHPWCSLSGRLLSGLLGDKEIAV